MILSQFRDRHWSLYLFPEQMRWGMTASASSFIQIHYVGPNTAFRSQCLYNELYSNSA